MFLIVYITTRVTFTRQRHKTLLRRDFDAPLCRISRVRSRDDTFGIEESCRACLLY